ncbi:MAG: DUF6562 domain-containing protein [Rikenellaceae bacterium]
MKSFIRLIISSLTIFVLMSCEKVFEYPDDNPVDPTLVNFDLNIKLAIPSDLEFELYDEVNLKSSGTAVYFLRTLIEIYDDGNSTTPIIRDTLYSYYDLIGELDLHYTTTLNAKCYDVAIWSDIAESNPSGDMYYYTASNLTQIKYTEPYVGNTDLKNAFATNIEIDLTGYRDEWNAVYEYVAGLERPQARFEIITTDLEQFLARHGDGGDESADIDDFTVEVLYDGYMPYGFNALTDKPNEARQSISYMTTMEDLNDGTARLAFDLVFVNHTESGVNVSLNIYDKSGEIVAQAGSIAIPIYRNMNTIVIDEYLTSDYAPGIGIDPSFDGEINVVIPD